MDFLTFPCAEDRNYIGYDLVITLAFIKTALSLRQNSNRPLLRLIRKDTESGAHVHLEYEDN